MPHAKIFDVTFPGGKRVYAHYNGRTVETDQSERNGGDGSAPEPFDLFWVSIVTCVGIYVLEFCNTRQLPTNGLGVHMEVVRNDAERRYDKVRIDITLPPGFPEKYRKAIHRSADLCTVKKHIFNPPEFEIRVVPS